MTGCGSQGKIQKQHFSASKHAESRTMNGSMLSTTYGASQDISVRRHPRVCNQAGLVVAGGHTLLVVARGLIVGVNDGVRGDAVGVVRLGPGVDGVDVRDVFEHSGAEEGEHSAEEAVSIRVQNYVRLEYKYRILRMRRFCMCTLECITCVRVPRKRNSISYTLILST